MFKSPLMSVCDFIQELHYCTAQRYYSKDRVSNYKYTVVNRRQASNLRRRASRRKES